MWVADVLDGTESRLECDTCGHRHAAPPGDVRTSDTHHWSAGHWEGSHCLRFRCPGRFRRRTGTPDSDYYRSLYRTGAPRRIVTAEHTGLLPRTVREELERAFKSGEAPDAPNVITATPTLEMGIDIGDLSAVMLTSIPPRPVNYVQRVGRAGRATGNALVLTFVPGDTHGLYYLSQPEAMLDGEIRTPNCYLDARETLFRQYNAYLLDRVADRTIDALPLARRMSRVMAGALDGDGALRRIIDASLQEPTHVDSFLRLFGDQLSDVSVEALREYSAAGIEGAIKNAVEVWRSEHRELGNRRDRLNYAIRRLEEGVPGPDDEVRLRDLRGQRAAIARLLQEMRGEYPLSGLERIGVLPNYTLLDDTVTLIATLWSREEGDHYRVDRYEYRRPGALAIREYAPGSSFYAGGHRHIVDAVEIGSSDQPLYNDWHLCPECAYGQPVGDETPDRCPRCGATGWADIGCRHRMLRLSSVGASGSEEDARVYDEADERDREQFDVIAGVDVDPINVVGAWRLDGKAFGAEYSRHVNIRHLNLGRARKAGERVRVGGEYVDAARFTVCGQCGAVREARERPGQHDGIRLHEGWCQVRSGQRNPDWRELVLYHQLTTDAVRVLLPISLYEIEERLATFKGSLLLGLRRDFGGDPDHLDVLTSELPNRSGQGRYRFLVLYDRVPGGTGYLDRLADPDRMRTILHGARQAIARCLCVNEGRRACHRCLLGAVSPREYELVSRGLALELLDDLLEDWEVDGSIGSVVEVDLGKVEESELERLFRVALQDWTRISDDVSMQSAVGQDGRRAWEIRFGSGETFKRYRMDEQAGLGTTPSTTPDFVIRRVDARGREVAVYLDGYQFHASPEHPNIAVDAEKRSGVRASGRWVWCLSWDDVVAFHKAVDADPPRTPTFEPLLKGTARTKARQCHAARSEDRIDYDTLDRNQMMLLLAYLARPDDEGWSDLACSLVAGVAGATGARPIASTNVSSALAAAAKAESLPENSAGPLLGTSWTNEHGLPLSAFLDLTQPSEERWTVVAALPDAEENLREDGHHARWQSWLHWSNVLQFLGPLDSERTAWIAGTSQADADELDNFWLQTFDAGRPGVPLDLQPRPVRPVCEISDHMVEELDLIVDDAVQALVQEALMRGAPDFVAGAEIDGVPIEAAWERHHVGVTPNDSPVDIDGWDIRAIEVWTADELLLALGGDG